jgi:hypothetical protein
MNLAVMGSLTLDNSDSPEYRTRCRISILGPVGQLWYFLGDPPPDPRFLASLGVLSLAELDPQTCLARFARGQYVQGKKTSCRAINRATCIEHLFVCAPAFDFNVQTVVIELVSVFVLVHLQLVINPSYGFAVIHSRGAGLMAKFNVLGGSGPTPDSRGSPRSGLRMERRIDMRSQLLLRNIKQKWFSTKYNTCWFYFFEF